MRASDNEQGINKLRPKVATLLKVTLLHRCFSRFFKFCKWYQITQSVSYEIVMKSEKLSVVTSFILTQAKYAKCLFVLCVYSSNRFKIDLYL